MKKEKERTTVYIDKEVAKKIKYMIADKDKTKVNSLTAAIDWGLRQLIKRKKM